MVSTEEEGWVSGAGLRGVWGSDINIITKAMFSVQIKQCASTEIIGWMENVTSCLDSARDDDLASRLRDVMCSRSSHVEPSAP